MTRRVVVFGACPGKGSVSSIAAAVFAVRMMALTASQREVRGCSSSPERPLHQLHLNPEPIQDYSKKHHVLFGISWIILSYRYVFFRYTWKPKQSTLRIKDPQFGEGLVQVQPPAFFAGQNPPEVVGSNDS